MLSIEDIKNVSFRRATFGGYKPEDVDNFIDDIESSYGKLLDERSQLLKKIDEINKVISKYREEEESIRNAIIAAQKLADASIKDAKEKAEYIINDAKSNAEKEKAISQKIYTEVNKFKDNLLRLYEEHIEFIKNIPSMSAEKINCESASKNEENLTDKVYINKLQAGNTLGTEKINVSIREIKSNDDDNCIDSGRIVEPELNKKKFENLKFGSDYDIKSESESNLKHGFFKRRK